jgi:hypothetical protein
MRSGKSLRVLFTAFIVAALAHAGLAQCVIFDKPEELFARSEMVFRGTVLAKKPTGIQGDHVIVEVARFRVDQTWKGEPGHQIAVGADRPFEVGRQYLVFASGKPPSTSIMCGSAQLVSDAKVKLDWLSRMQ